MAVSNVGDVFISWTGEDEILMTQINSFLTEKGIKCIDSKSECCGNFVKWSKENADKSTLFLLILTNNVIKKLEDPKNTIVKEFRAIKNKWANSDLINRLIIVYDSSVLETDESKNKYEKIDNFVKKYFNVESLSYNDINDPNKIYSDITKQLTERFIAMYNTKYEKNIPLLNYLDTDKLKNEKATFEKLYVLRQLKDVNNEKEVGIKEFLDAENVLFLSGESGSGKSLFMIEAQRNWVKNHTDKMAIMLKCSDLANKKNILNAMHTKFRNQIGEKVFITKTISKKVFTDKLRKKNLLMIFDGMDEVPDKQSLSDIITKIKDFYKTYNEPKMIFTSRYKDHYNQITHLDNVKKYEVIPFNDEQIEKFSNNFFNIFGLKEKIISFCKELKHIQDDIKYNPLMLTQLAMIYSYEETLPKSNIKIYEKVIELIVNSERQKIIGNVIKGISKKDKEILKNSLKYILMDYARIKYSYDARNKNYETKNIFIKILRKYLDTAQEIDSAAESIDEYLHKRNILIDGGFYHKGILEYLTALSYYKEYDITEKVNSIRELLNYFGNEYYDDVINYFFLLMNNKSLDSEELTKKCETILKEVRVISNGAFYGCNKLEKITIPNSVTRIGDYAFSWCSSLTSVTFEKGSRLTSIGDWAFYNCSFLTSITIPNSVTSIGDSAFEDCSSLTSIIIPNSVTSIGDSAFKNCSSLENVYYKGTIEDWCKINFSFITSNPMAYAKHFYMLNANNEYEEVTEIAIPNTITSIGAYQFYGFSNVASIVIPNSVTSIGDGAFYGCSSLTSVTFEERSKLTKIGYYAFYGCSSLTSIEIPNSVTRIGDRAFYGCSSLTSIEIPNSVTSIGHSAFEECSSLTSIEIPKSVTSIGSHAFYGCSSLTSIVIPNSVTSIGHSAFYGCSSLTSIVIPNSVTSIGECAFYNCDSLQYNEYRNCLYLGNENNPYLILVQEKGTNITEAIIHTDTKFIMDFAFSGCSSLTSIVIPNSVTSIGERAFSGCSSLTSVTFEEGSRLTSVGADAFWDCDSLQYNEYGNCLYLGNEENPYLVLVKAKDTNITEVVIHRNTRLILEYGFGGCNSLQYNEYGNCLYLGNEDNPYLVLVHVKDTNITEVMIHTNTRFIMECAFQGCSSLTSIIIQNSVTSIGSFAFCNCSSLASIVIPNSITRIGFSAFQNCSSLTIYCEASSQPSGWYSYWHSDIPIYWKHQWKYVEGKPVIVDNRE